MKRFVFCVFSLFCLLLTLPASADAPAKPLRMLKIFTGPGEEYVPLEPPDISTALIAIEYEKRGKTDFVLLRFEQNGETCCGYADRASLAIDGDLPCAQPEYLPYILVSEDMIFAAPTSDAAMRDFASENHCVAVLRYDYSYAYIEYLDLKTDLLSRGWICDWDLASPEEYVGMWAALAYDEFAPAKLELGSILRMGPGMEYAALELPSGNPSAIECEIRNDKVWVLLIYESEGLCGYVPQEAVEVNGYIRSASYEGDRSSVLRDAQVYVAPYATTLYRGQVSAGQTVTWLTNFGDYDYIEYEVSGQLFRGWIDGWNLR